MNKTQKAAPPKQPWKPAQATTQIRKLAVSEQLDLSLTSHAKSRLQERDLIVSDVLHLLERGFVYEKPEPATRAGFFKYKMESKTPNSGARQLRAVIIPDGKACHVKVVTVMWVDEAGG